MTLEMHAGETIQSKTHSQHRKTERKITMTIQQALLRTEFPVPTASIQERPASAMDIFSFSSRLELSRSGEIVPAAASRTIADFEKSLSDRESYLTWVALFRHEIRTLENEIRSIKTARRDGKPWSGRESVVNTMNAKLFLLSRRARQLCNARRLSRSWSAGRRSASAA
jgi:hypothetical protein